MSTVATETTARATVFAWIKEAFEGDLPEAARAVAARVADEGLLEDLWAECGGVMLADLYRTSIITSQRTALIRSVRSQVRDAAPQPDRDPRDVFAVQWWQGKDGRYHDLGNLTKAECLEIAAAYDERAASSTARAEFLRAVAKGMRGKKTVGETYSADQILNLMRDKGI